MTRSEILAFLSQIPFDPSRRDTLEEVVGLVRTCDESILPRIESCLVEYADRVSASTAEAAQECASIRSAARSQAESEGQRQELVRAEALIQHLFL